jgi:Tfp pilus assembly protein PilF
VPEQLIHLDSRKLLTRIVTLIVLLLVAVWGFFLVKWYLGNTIAEYFDPDNNGAETARLAVSLAPNDPLTHWRLADFIEKRLPPDQIGNAVKEYEKAVSLSPQDYRFWMAFGRALEQAGDTDRSERALRRAVQLAPAYSFPRWYLGNLLLRVARYDEGFVELQKASEANPELRPQLFNLAWEVYKEDIGALTSAAGKTAEARAQFSSYLVARGRVEDGMRLWASLSENEKRQNLGSGHEIITNLLNAKRFHDAVLMWNDVIPGENHRVKIGEITDGSFELGISRTSGAPFGWQVQSQPQAQVGIDPNMGHDGSRSLRVVFQVRSKLDVLNISQLVPVHPNTQYTFECYLKTNKLETAATPYVAILDGNDGAGLASSNQAPTGTTDWQRIELKFKTPPATQAINIRISPASCGENTVCPMFGAIWYDDFTLKLGN